MPGGQLTWHACELIDDSAVVTAGNGGGGLVCARHLLNYGESVDVLDREPAQLTGAAAHQYGILDEMSASIGIGSNGLDRVDEYAIVVDALIGYGLSGDVRGPARDLIQGVNCRKTRTLSLDVPSGIDATTGETLGIAVRPDRIVTLALPKTGLVDVETPLYLADISIPHVVYDLLGITYENPFDWTGWVELQGMDT